MPIEQKRPKSGAASALRWITVIPGAFAASIAAALVAWGITWLTSSIIPTRLDLIWNFIVIAAASGWAFVAGGTWIAPRYFSIVPISLAAIGGALALSSIFLSHSGVEWIPAARGLLTAAASVGTAMYIRQQGGL